ncbi:MAG: helix-turn-helix domain-containing protein [Planctomycetota bacterium]|jgi:transcriptional regulator with XRE-family HTH domain
MMGDLLEDIRKAIKASKKTRYRIWKETGIAQAQLSRLMDGTTGLSIETIERLAECLGLEILIRPKGRKKGK